MGLTYSKISSSIDREAVIERAKLRRKLAGRLAEQGKSEGGDLVRPAEVPVDDPTVKRILKKMVKAPMRHNG